jgi:hypothetical protein
VKRPLITLARLAGAAVVATAAVVAGAPSASATGNPACGSLFHPWSGSAYAQYCPMWRGSVPVYDPPGGKIVGYLWEGGSANWFWCQNRFAGVVSTVNGYSSDWWAYTVADNGRSGAVPGTYYAGSSAVWGGTTTAPPGLRHC